VAVVCAWTPARAAEQQPFTLYSGATSDRGSRPEPALPPIGAAGSTWLDPAFATRTWRVTDPDDPAGDARFARHPLATRDVVSPVLLSKEVVLADAHHRSDTASDRDPNRIGFMTR
jgi:hypothetical protein